MSTDDHELVFRIGLVGPSRVGKTSLITALLRDSQRLLQGTPVSMRPLAEVTTTAARDRLPPELESFVDRMGLAVDASFEASWDVLRKLEGVASTASVTRAASAVPPTSRKLAGLLP